MTVEEAFNSMTINAAHALNWEDIMGAIWPGSKANFILLQENYTLNTIPYYYGSGPFGTVFLGGEIFQ
jgi:imidazolonepropionase